MSWNKQIEVANNKLNGGIGILKKPLKLRPRNTLKQLYNSFMNLFNGHVTLV